MNVSGLLALCIRNFSTLSALYICPSWQPVGMAADVSLSVRSPHHLWDRDRRYENVSKNVTIGCENMSREIKIRRYFRSDLANYLYRLNQGSTYLLEYRKNSIKVGKKLMIILAKNLNSLQQLMDKTHLVQLSQREYKLSL